MRGLVHSAAVAGDPCLARVGSAVAAGYRAAVQDGVRAPWACVALGAGQDLYLPAPVPGETWGERLAALVAGAMDMAGQTGADADPVVRSVLTADGWRWSRTGLRLPAWSSPVGDLSWAVVEGQVPGLCSRVVAGAQ